MKTMTVSHALSVARLGEAFTGHRCVTAWLGYGNVLFLGFGETVLPARSQGGQRTPPPFELQTNFADWFVDGPISASTTDSDRAQLAAAAESLINEQIIDWNLSENTRLRIAFSGAKELEIKAWNADEDLADAWCLKSPDGYILAVATNGRHVIVESSLPVRDWFRPAEQ